MKILDEATLQNLKVKILDNQHLYILKNSFLAENLSINDYEDYSSKMTYDEDNQSSCDEKNAEYIYEKFKDIPIELATEEAFWVYLSHIEFWNYLQKRWPVTSSNNENEINTSTISNRYFFGREKPFYRQGLSRLWWAAHLTYDHTLVDPYKYTKIAMKDQERMSLLIETVNLSRNKTALFAVLDILDDLDKKKEQKIILSIPKERQNVLRPLTKFVNAIGGVTVWDLLSHEEAKEKIQNFIDQLVEDGIIILKKVDQY